MDEKDTASRKWQLTFNNPAEHGYLKFFIKNNIATGVIHRSPLKSRLYLIITCA